MPLSSLCSVILAAGESTRMGADKALLPWRETTFLGSLIDTFHPFSDYVIVVAGKNARNLQPVVDSLGAFLVVNPRPERGQFSSLQVGLREVLNRGRDTALVTLVDRPPPARETLRRLYETYAEVSDRGKWVVIPEYDGRHGHPILIGPGLLAKLVAAPPESNAREIIHQNSEQVEYLPVDDPLVVTNINTPEQYADLKSRQHGD